MLFWLQLHLLLLLPLLLMWECCDWLTVVTHNWQSTDGGTVHLSLSSDLSPLLLILHTTNMIRSSLGTVSLDVTQLELVWIL